MFWRVACVIITTISCRYSMNERMMINRTLSCLMYCGAGSQSNMSLLLFKCDHLRLTIISESYPVPVPTHDNTLTWNYYSFIKSKPSAIICIDSLICIPRPIWPFHFLQDNLRRFTAVIFSFEWRTRYECATSTDLICFWRNEETLWLSYSSLNCPEQSLHESFSR